MSKNWTREHHKDPYYRRAKAENYRSRASYKLIQIDDRFHLFRTGDVVLDLGASPGGWSQVAVERVGPQGFVLGVDMDPIKPMDGAEFIVGDITDSGVQGVMLSRLGDARGIERFTVIISDLSPTLTGNYSMDQANSVYLCETAIEIAGRLLREGGNMVMKVFEGEDFKEFLSRVRGLFRSARPFSPKASRSRSSEVYLVLKGFKGGAGG